MGLGAEHQPLPGAFTTAARALRKNKDSIEVSNWNNCVIWGFVGLGMS